MRFTTRRCLLSCSLLKNGDTTLLAHQNPLKFGQITRTSNISTNHRRLIVYKLTGSWNSNNITSNSSINQARHTQSQISCQDRQVLIRGRMTTKTSFCYQNTTFITFIYNYSEQNTYLEPSLKQSENDYPASKEINTTNRPSKDLVRTIQTGLIMDTDLLHTRTEFIFPLIYNFAQI